MHKAVKEIQFIRHLMRQLGLHEVTLPNPMLNDNQGSVDWVESGCKATKKLRHKNISDSKSLKQECIRRSIYKTG